MALLDSTVELRKRAEFYGMSDASCDKFLKEAPTLAALAFVLGGQPISFQEESFQKWTDQLGITDQPDLLACRRLLFEAHTLMIAHVKEQVSGSSSQSDAGKRLPPLERQSRLDKLRKDIQVPVRGDSEPSHELVHFFSGMVEARCLQHIPLHRCASREAEAAVPPQGRGKQVLRLENGALEVFQQNHVKSVDVTDGLRMAACLHRRAAAMAVAGLISYGVAQKWSEKLTSALPSRRDFLQFPSRKSWQQTRNFGESWRKRWRETLSPSPMVRCLWTQPSPQSWFARRS